MPLRLPPPPSLRPAGATAVALLAPMGVLLVGLALRPLIYAIPFGLFFVAVVIVTYAGGLRAGAMTIAVSAALGVWWFVPPYGAFTGARDEVFALVIFLPVSAIAAVLAESVRRGYGERAQSDAWFRTLAETIPQLVFTIRRDGSGEYHNGRFATYTGLPTSALRGDGWTGAVHPQDLENIREALAQADESDRLGEVTFRLRRADGAYRWFNAALVPLRGADGKLVRCVGSATDVQDQREAADAQARAIEARDVFLSIASHELKSPVAAALLQVQRAQRILAGDGRPCPPGLTRSLQATVGTVERLDGLIGSLLDVSRITMGRLALSRAAYDLSAAISGVAARFSETARRASCALELDLEPGIQAVGDRGRVEQVVTNLLANALKYGAGNPVSIALRLDGGEHAVITVGDHGIGIAPDDQERIFERFERAVSAHHYGGLGLGLWIAREIAEASGGRLHLVSRPGEGSTFTFDLPLQLGADGARA